jgi:histidinol-phosphate/aromatic aminotransferase/cobyric acid decarboxylase-like protein
MRVGFALARRELVADAEPYRPPGSVAIPSVAVVTAALRDPEILRASLARIERERQRLADAFAAVGLPAGPSVTNFLLVDVGGLDAARVLASGLLARGLVPRTFGPDHPLAGHLRFTVRDEAQDDRLIAALGELAPAVHAARAAASRSQEVTDS